MTDQELVSSILKGDLGSFTLLVKQNERLVFAMVRKLLGNRNEDVEDVCQEVFLKIYHNLASFKQESKLSTWIARIAYNAAINYCEKRSLATTELTDKTEAPENDQSPENALIEQDERSYLQAQIERLPVNYKTCLMLFHYEEMNYKEIEQITGWPESTVKSNLFRARKMLKEQLEKYQDLNRQRFENAIR